MKTAKFLFLLIISLNFSAQEISPIKVFTALDYKAQNQNWAVNQSNKNIIYVANNAGLLEFDGEHWKLYEDESNPILRSVKVKNDKIYTGSFMDFGFWIKNLKGELEYTSIVKEFAIKLKDGEEFWNVNFYQEWILFQSKARIYFVNPITKKVKTIDSKESISGLFLMDDKIYFQKQNVGLFTIENGNELLFSNLPFFKNNKIINCFNQNNELIFLSEENGFVSIVNGKITQKKSSLSNSNYSVYSAKQLNDNSFVVGTISNGILFLNENREITGKINKENGLSNNTALSLFQDNFDNIWVGLDNGINHINTSSSFKIFEDEEGLLGTVYTSLSFDDNLYLGTNQGLFYRDNIDNKYKLIAGTEGQVWFLKEIDNLLFCGHDKGTFIIKNNKIKNSITNVAGTWDIKSVAANSSILIQGNYQGLSIIEKNGESWKFRNKIDRFDISSRFFDFYEDKLYVNHELKGFYELSLDKNYKKVIQEKKIKIPESGYGSNIFKFGDDLIYSSSTGVYRKKIYQEFTKDTLFTNAIEKFGSLTTLKKLASQKNTYYSFSESNLLFITQNPINLEPQFKQIPLSISTRNNVLGFENLTQISEDKFLIGTSYGYLIYDKSAATEKDNVTISFRSILVNKIDESKFNISLNNEAILENKQNNIEFYYSIPKFDKIIKNEYQYQLLGLSDNWSNWSQNSSQLFDNLPYGDYTLNIRGRYGNQTTEIKSFSFTIKRPYYLSVPFIIIYIILISIIVIGINLYYKIRYKRRNNRLLEKAKNDLEVRELENQKQVIQLRNEKLRNDIQSKNKELATSTMNIIKKNELLNNLKKELKSVEGKKIDQVIKIIDKNLNNTDDWKMFQEAFNNADKDFLKKIKIKHAILSPNDLRLCAYLRLNLSSKEIAPLLNISPRSVEVKRYRLRKKLELDHDMNLSDYILSV